jgi:hypothetical protein
VKESDTSLEGDSSISEISILPDGRVCVFGASRRVLEMLDAVHLGDPTLKDRIDCLYKDGDVEHEHGLALHTRTGQ